MAYDYERIDSSIQQLNRSLDAISAKMAAASREIKDSLSTIAVDLERIAVKDEVIDSYSDFASSVKNGFHGATEHIVNFKAALDCATDAAEDLKDSIESALENAKEKFSNAAEAFDLSSLAEKTKAFVEETQELISGSDFEKKVQGNVSVLAKKD